MGENNTCVVIPVGHVFELHLSAWMQPRENMKARAALQRSAPFASWRTSEKPLYTFPKGG